MAKGKKSFTMYCDWKEMFEALPPEKAGELIVHVMRYVNDENPQSDDILINAVFAPIKATLKRDLKKWEAVRKRNQANARKRWDANASDRIPPDTKNAVSVSDNVIDKSIIPEWEEFLEYSLICSHDVDRKHLRAKYDQWKDNKWRDGHDKPIKNWKTKIRNTLPYLKTYKKNNGDYGPGF